MSELSEVSEKIADEELGSAEAADFPLSKELSTATDSLRERLDGGESFDQASEGMVVELHELIVERLDQIKEVVSGLDRMVERCRGLLGDELADTLHAGLEVVSDVLEKGSTWVRENPEVVEAGATLLVIAVFAAYQPEAAAKLLLEQPEILGAPLERLLEELA